VITDQSARRFLLGLAYGALDPERRLPGIRSET